MSTVKLKGMVDNVTHTQAGWTQVHIESDDKATHVLIATQTKDYDDFQIHDHCELTLEETET